MNKKNEWKNIDSMPFDRKVIILTVTGLIRVAKRCRDAMPRKKRYFPEITAVHCFRADGRSGDLMAIKWKELK